MPNTEGTGAGPSRRGVLRAGLAAAAGIGAGALAATPSSAAVRPDWWQRPLRKPGSLPYPHLKAGTDTIPQIKHIVILMQENHSYDNRLGLLRRHDADGFRLRDGVPTATNPYANGDLQHAFHMPTTCQLDGRPTQEWTESHIQFDSGRNDGFVKSLSGPVAMGYWDEGDQPFYYSLARTFPIADRYFCSVLGQTYPNRRYLISATSLGMIDDTLPGATEYPKNGTIFDRLEEAKHVYWRDYYSTSATTELYLPLYARAINKEIVPITHFFADAKAGTLPAVSLVEPNYDTTSEENPQNIAQGEQFAASVIDAVMSGPGWKDTVLIWTYDEHGGYYDHVPPPPALAPDDIAPEVTKGTSAYNGFRQYGFRVPCAVISPWARRHYVSHRVMDHTSICALIEAKWNLPAMTYRDANAHNMLDMLDLNRPHFLTPPTLAKPLLDTDPSALACNKSGPGTIPPPGSVTPPAAP
jgi:phospholipase C